MDCLWGLQSPPLSLSHPHKRQASQPGGGWADLIFPRPLSGGTLTMPWPKQVSTSEEVSSIRKGNNKISPRESGLPPQRQASQAAKLPGLRSPQRSQRHVALGTEGKCYCLSGISGIVHGGAQRPPPPGCGPPGRRTGPRTPSYHVGLKHSDGHLQGTTQPQPTRSTWCRQEVFRAETSVNKENNSRAQTKMFPQFKTSPPWGNKVKWGLIVSFKKLRLFYSHKNVLD